MLPRAMKRVLGLIALAILGLVTAASAAEPEKKATLPQGTTNVFSNWTVASSNLTVKTPTSPWGRSLSVYVPAKAPRPRAVVEAMERLHRDRAERAARERVEKLLNGSPFSEQYHVHLSQTSDRSTYSPAK
jgi:Ni,Fe-hydrogenase III small subunit